MKASIQADLRDPPGELSITHLMMKSNSEPASISTPSRVEMAPSITGANICSIATAARVFLSPMAVRKPYNVENRENETGLFDFIGRNTNTDELLCKMFLPVQCAQ